MTLGAGNYTAQVTGENGATGVALVEVYDTDFPGLTRSKSLFARAQVQSGAGAQIGGLVIEGGVKKMVLLRAAGPALAAFGLSGVLAKPTLTLFKDGVAIATATEWGGAEKVVAIRATTMTVEAFGFAEGSADAALLLQLEPGAYTLAVTGEDGGSGVTLAEVYEAGGCELNDGTAGEKQPRRSRSPSGENENDDDDEERER